MGQDILQTFQQADGHRIVFKKNSSHICENQWNGEKFPKRVPKQRNPKSIFHGMDKRFGTWWFVEFLIEIKNKYNPAKYWDPYGEHNEHILL